MKHLLHGNGHELCRITVVGRGGFVHFSAGHDATLRGDGSARTEACLRHPGLVTPALDVDVASVAGLFGDPARCRMLHALIDGTERPAGALARVAGVSAATASGHLRRLVDAGLLVVRPAGRHRYYALAGPTVATALESLAAIAAPVPVRSLRQSRAAAAMAEARSCYDHLAGRAGVALRAALLDREALIPDGPRDYRLTDIGRTLLTDLGIDPGEVEQSRRVLARDCLDWSQRRPHLAGACPGRAADPLPRPALGHASAGRPGP